MDFESGLLFEAGRLLNFYHFQQVKHVYFETQREDVYKQTRFPLNTLKKTPTSGKSLIGTNSILISIPSLLKSVSEFSGAAS